MVPVDGVRAPVAAAAEYPLFSVLRVQTNFSSFAQRFSAQVEIKQKGETKERNGLVTEVQRTSQCKRGEETMKHV
jgi:hypothetical protein